MRVPIGVIKEGERNPKHWFLLVGGPAPPQDEVSSKNLGSDSTGNLYFGGYHFGTSKASLRRYNSDGTKQISKIFDRNVLTQEWFHQYGFDVSSSGNIYIVNLRGDGSSYLSRRDSSGNEQWRLAYTAGFVAPGQTIDSLENRYVVFQGFQSPNAMVLSKLNSSGSVLFQRMLRNNSVLDGNGNETADGISASYPPSIDTAGNIIISGGIQRNFSNSASSTGGAIFIKYDSSGTLQWQKKLVETPETFFIVDGTVTDSSNNIYSFITNPAISGASVVKLDPSGNIVWQRNILGINAFGLGDIILDSFSNCYVSAQSGDLIFFAKYNSSGVLQWQRTVSISSSSFGDISSILVSDDILIIESLIFPYIGNKRHILMSIPADGSVTGSYKIEGRTLTISPSSLTEFAASITASNTSFLIGSPPSIFGGDPGARSISDLVLSDTIVKV